MYSMIGFDHLHVTSIIYANIIELLRGICQRDKKCNAIHHINWIKLKDYYLNITEQAVNRALKARRGCGRCARPRRVAGDDRAKYIHSTMHGRLSRSAPIKAEHERENAFGNIVDSLKTYISGNHERRMDARKERI